ncbi:transcriptional regulator GcvA [Aliivibrio sifiae]|uniref:LysR family transcriptional regulator n=1 Tax=Aliivibrio sifiae TaxID=566293 RepID=A0A2S7X1Z9_9GAMM|nr:transcriptional regulator GcvA [Aliivibrio sifiae]PQJ84155.1 LysR family transcriptional regulator [Aliivibrio sifiae]
MKLSHLNGLKAFEASARHLSFSLAAKELNVTPAAIGQQVKLLEEWLGISLFERRSSGASRLVLTKEATQGLPEIIRGFTHLSQGLELLKPADISPVLTVAVSPAFAAKWLLMRIDDFQISHPEWDLRLDTNIRTVDYLAESIDIGVRYGKGNWEGLEASLLITESIFPVCSPELFNKGIDKLESLVHLPLLHDLSLPKESGFPSWNSWFEQHEIYNVNTDKGLKINNSASVIQAAISGQGIALGRSVLVQDDLDCGRLVQLFPDLECSIELAYYVVWKKNGLMSDKVKAFKEWLQQQMIETR